MATCETSESTSNPIIGIVLVLLACCCYAFGNCMQRFSLLKAPGEKVFGVLNRHVGWLIGAIIYFSANGLYAVALSFAPVTTLAAIFSLTIVANATCAVFMLGDKIPKWAYLGYAFVLTGSVVFSVTLDAQACSFDGSEIIEVMTTPQSIAYWIVMGLVILCGGLFAWRFEKKHPLVQQPAEMETEHVQDSEIDASYNYVQADVVEEQKQENNEQQAVETKQSTDDDKIEPWSLLIARFTYPASLGATEAVGSLILKAVNSLLTTIATADGDDAVDSATDDGGSSSSMDIGLWVGLMVSGAFIFLGIVLWLRLVYSRFEITGAFPVEFGMLTLASVVGGFMVFQDHEFVETTTQWVGVGIAGACIIGGIGIVAYTSWQAKVLEEEEKANSES